MVGYVLLVILMYLFQSKSSMAEGGGRAGVTIASTMETTTETADLTGAYTRLPPETPADVHTGIWNAVVVVTGCGVSVGVILLGSAILFSTKRTGKCVHLSSKTSIPGKTKYASGYMGKLSSGEYLPSGYDETYSIVTYERRNIGQKPQMSVQHFPGEYVLLMCTLPGSADHDARCNLYFGENNHPVQTATSWKKRDKKNRLLCRFIFTIDDFLRRLHFLKGHDASCDYSLGSEANSLSPRSDGYSLTDIVEKEPSKISAFTTPPDIVEKDTRLTKTMLTSTMTTGMTVSRLHSSTRETPSEQTSGTVGSRNTGSFINTSIKPVKPTQGQNPYTSSTQAILSPVTPETPSSETWTWKLVIVAASLGGVIVLGLAFLFTKRTTERCAAKRTQANVTDELMCMRKLDHGGSLPAGNDEAYSMITSVPAAGCLTGPEKQSRQASQNEDSDIYHVYSTISEEPAPSALNDMVYSTLQAY
ncbi:uncharacterized protein LOC117489703 isoform X4 [Trematomus bernacchii]|uniref:uncharacterized protein LOC117489703 isoform X4 n=1 Tax=Trematomus bernacchii TaxID=40690 RepID=UPI00146DCBC3|nr:uncharacterized protein LOC117489703 isoform X4 [Trematomus bernacchii]